MNFNKTLQEKQGQRQNGAQVIPLRFPSDSWAEAIVQWWGLVVPSCMLLGLLDSLLTTWAILMTATCNPSSDQNCIWSCKLCDFTPPGSQWAYRQTERWGLVTQQTAVTTMWDVHFRHVGVSQVHVLDVCYKELTFLMFFFFLYFMFIEEWKEEAVLYFLMYVEQKTTGHI